jgi:hypothetical protein
MSSTLKVEESVRDEKVREREVWHHYRKTENHHQRLVAIEKQDVPQILTPTKAKKNGSGRFGKSVGVAILKEIKTTKSDGLEWNLVNKTIEVPTKDGKVFLKLGKNGEVIGLVETDHNEQPIDKQNLLANESIAKLEQPKLDSLDNSNSQSVHKIGLA